MDDNSDDDWFKNWLARYKQLLAYVGDKAKIDANSAAKGAFNDAEYYLSDSYRKPSKTWTESRKDYYNRWMENDLNTMGKALAGSKWKTFRCGATVNGYRGDCGMLC